VAQLEDWARQYYGVKHALAGRCYPWGQSLILWWGLVAGVYIVLYLVFW
jgi:hypothetical protein